MPGGLRVLTHWVNTSLKEGKNAYVTKANTIWELVVTRIQYKLEMLVVWLVEVLDII